MNPTQNTNNPAPEPTSSGPALFGTVTWDGQFKLVRPDGSPVCEPRQLDDSVVAPQWSVADGRTTDPCVELARLAESAGYVLTDAGREALASASAGFVAKAVKAVRHGVTPDQIATDDWDGEPWFEQRQPEFTPIPVSGWCKQCGNALPWVKTWDEPLCSDCVVIVPVPEPDGINVPDVLRSAALYLERHGWVQGSYYDPTATIFTPAADLVGAIAMVCYGGPCEAPSQHFTDPGFADFEAAVLHMDRWLLVMDGSEAYEFNDAKDRTSGQVIDALRKAATVPAEELIDALRVLDNLDGSAEVHDRIMLLVGPDRDAESRCRCTDGNNCWCDCPEESDAPCCPGTRSCAHCAAQHRATTGGAE